ncbi:beta strand repeat-containing protein, partial [Paenibacillus sp. TAF58]
FGGGLFVSGSALGKVQLTDVVFNNNTAGLVGSANYGSRGGGIYLEGDMRLEMSNLTIKDNISYGLGGGMAIVSASSSLRTVTLDSSTITGNKANSKSGGVEGRAGGLYLGTSAVITKTDILKNTAGGDGGGLVLDFFAGSVSLTDANVKDNTALRGGGMFINANKAPSLTNTFITGNSVGDIAVNPDGTDMKVTIAPKTAPAGTFSQGKTGAHYLVTVRNNGNVHTNGTVTAKVTLPAELTATSLVGTGWTCTLGTKTCTRSDVLNGQSDYPVIDVTVNVAAGAQRSVTSIATVSGGDELDVSNDTGSHVTTILSNDSTLSGLIITASTLKETFASGTTAYTADVLNAINSITITPTVNESHATVTVNNTNVISGQPSGSLGLTVGNNNITVLVTAEDGFTQKTYTIKVTRLPKSTNAKLSDLKVDGTSITGFASGTLGYTVNVPNVTTAVLVAGTKADATASVVVSGGSNLTVGNNTVTVTVTAEDGTTVITYTVTVVRAKSSNANLNDLKVEGTSIAGFASGTLAYTVNVPNATTSVVVTGTKADATASLVVSGGSNLVVGNNTVTVTVTAEDGTTVIAYTVTVVRAASSNADLSDLKVDGTSIAGFASSTLGYTVNVPNTTTAVVVAGTKADATASVVVSGGSNLAVGNNTAMVTVTAEDGTTVITYTLTVIRAASSNASLSDLKVDGTSITGFASGTLGYTVNVPNATTAVVAAGTKADATASVVVSGGSNLVVGNNMITVTVTAEDGTTVITYTVTVIRAASSNADLSDLKVDGTSITGFTSGTLGYTVNVPNVTTAVIVA